MELLANPWFLAAALPAVTLMGFAKGGFSGIGLLSMPLLVLVIPPVQAAAIMLPVLMVQDAVTVWAYRHTWDRGALKVMLPGAFIGILAGYYSATLVNDAMIRLLVGVIAVTFCVLKWSGWVVDKHPDAPHDIAAATFWGVLSGFTSFVVHAGGPPFNAYMLPRGLPQSWLAGTGGVYFAILNLVKALPYFLLGQLSWANMTTAAGLFPVAVLANIAGVWLIRKMPTVLFYRIVYALTFLVGLKLIWDGLSGLIG